VALLWAAALGHQRHAVPTATSTTLLVILFVLSSVCLHFRRIPKGGQHEWTVGWDMIVRVFHDHPCWAFSMDLAFDRSTGKQETDTSSILALKYRSRMTDRSIHDYAHTCLNQHVEYVRQFHGSANVILLGHSMGGVVSCLYKTLFPSKVHRVVTFGSPVQGAPLLRWKLVAAMNNTKRHREMTPGSELLEGLTKELSNDRHIFTIGSAHDVQVPDSHSGIPGCKHLTIERLGHASMIGDESAMIQVHDWLHS
jgi:pimeloyl-ACP methyl ester carboxylesterase